MNNWFNFNIPYFNAQFGEDWGPFLTIVDTNVDTIMNKTWELYRLRDITMMPISALDLSLRLREIKTDPMDTITTKKLKIRKFNKTFKSKGMSDIYLDYQEQIVGIRGAIYSGYYLGSSVWGYSVWATPGSPTPEDRIWSQTNAMFYIYLDCKTTDSGLLDQIEIVYRQPSLLPAFYQIYFIDSSFNILRTV